MSDEDISTENVAYKTKQSILWYTTVPFSIHFLRFANSIFLARILSPSDFGIIGIITVILYYCDSFSQFGFGKAIVQKDVVTENHFYSYFSFNFTVSLLFFVTAQIFASSIAQFYEIQELENAVRVFSLLFLITSFSVGPKAKLNRKLEFKTLAIIEAAKVVVSMATSISLALNGYEFWSIVIAMLVAQSVYTMLVIATSQLVPHFRLDTKCLREMFHFGMWDFVNGQFALLSESADKLIIGKILGASALGFYDKALGLARMPHDQISLRLSHVSFSTFSRLKHDNAELQRYFSRMVVLNSVIMVPAFIGFLWVAEIFTVVLLGEKWLPMVSSLKIFAVAFLVRSFTNPIISINFAKAKIKHQTIIRIILTLLMILGILKFASYGIEVVALIVVIYNVLMMIFSFLLMSLHLHIGWCKLFRSLYPGFLLAGGMVLALFIFDQINITKFQSLRLVLDVLVGSVSYFIFFMVLPLKDLNFIRKRVMRRINL